MKCMSCSFGESKVIDSRALDDGRIRRRRECLNCGKRFSTYETIETNPLLVVKNNGARQSFDASKIKRGIIKACDKRSVSSDTIDELVRSIEKHIFINYDSEVPSEQIGELVMRALKEIDQVAYVRFASVYRQFRDVGTFIDFINSFEKKIREEQPT